MTTQHGTVRIAVDAVGGDFAPTAVLDGVDAAIARDSDLVVHLVGPEAIVAPFAAARAQRVVAVPAEQVIGMDEHPAAAVRSKRDSSIVVGTRLVKDRVADGFFSAGSTGAVMAAATLFMGRVDGVARPAIATVIPTVSEPVVLLDVGANADCKPEYLLQFAHMGSAYAEVVLGASSPRVALLNIGEEPAKGSQLAQDAHHLMAETVSGFVGNVEGRDVLNGVADVIVTDGFTGNVVLKLLEGSSSTLLAEIKRVMTDGPVRKAAAAVLAPSLREMRDRLDPDVHGGAPLLGVDGVCIIAHGSSRPRAVDNGLRVAAAAVRGGLTERISRAMRP